MTAELQDVRVVLACHDSHGRPTIIGVIVRATADDLDMGDHYWTAEDWATDDGYEGPVVCFDEQDCRHGDFALFELVDWSAVKTVEVRRSF